MDHPFFKQPGWKLDTFLGSKYHYLSIPAHNGKHTFLLLHGFPTGPFSYHTFIPQLTAHGYGVIVPELKGYGQTDKPHGVEGYAYKKMSDEIAAILDKEDINKVILVGHDFGSPLAARFSAWHSDRVIGMILASTPYSPPYAIQINPDILVAKLKPLLGYENVGYIKYFASEQAPKDMNAHLDSVLAIMYGPPEGWKTHLCPTGGLEHHLKSNFEGPIEPWFKPEDQATLREYLTENKFEGPTSWFRMMVSTANIHDDAQLTHKHRVEHPFLFLAPKHDAAYPPPMARPQAQFCADITIKEVDTGHWVFEHDPKGVADVVLGWLKEKKLD